LAARANFGRFTPEAIAALGYQIIEAALPCPFPPMEPSPMLREMLAEGVPLLVAVEAKDDSLNDGLSQCMAEMIALQCFNQARGKVLPVIHGCISNGREWLFMSLEDHTITLDPRIQSLEPVSALLGRLVGLVRQQLG
jgi:hypothetical protein